MPKQNPRDEDQQMEEILREQKRRPALRPAHYRDDDGSIPPHILDKMARRERERRRQSSSD